MRTMKDLGGVMSYRFSMVCGFVLLASLPLPPMLAAQEAAAVCALGAIRECGPELDCLPASPWQDPEPPGFFRLDVESSTITILSPASRRGEVTKVLGMERDGDHIVLTGIEAGRGKCIDAGLLEP